MKKVLLVTLLVLAFVLSLCLTVGAIDRTESKEYVVSIDQTESIKGASVLIAYDSNNLEIESGEWLVSGSMLASFTPAKGNGVIAFASGVSFGGDVVKFKVKAKSDAEFKDYGITVTLTLTPATGDNIVLTIELDDLSVVCAHKGTTTNVAEVPATCVSEGTTAGVKCDVCGEFISGGETISATGIHTWNEGEVTTPADCTNPGVKTYTCTVCKTETKEETIKPLGHDWGPWVDDKDGEHHTHTCTRCPATETTVHSWDNGEVKVPATHTSVGTLLKTCTDCGATTEEEILKLTEHTYTPWTDDKNGETHSRNCTAGDDPQTENHAWDNGVVTENATCTKVGTMTYTCTVCGATKTSEIKMTEHKYKAVWTELDEENHHRICYVCGEEEQVEAHKWGTAKVVKPATCVEDGELEYKCTVCNAIKKVTVNATGVHVFGEWSDSKDGETHFRVCKLCGEEIEKTSHTFSIVFSDDETYHWHECTVCGAKTGVEEHVPGPDATEWNPQVCTICGRILKTANRHFHDISQRWTANGMGHWHACSGCNELFNYGKHVYDNDCDATCNVCGYVRKTITHDYAEVWSSDGTSHWHECTNCGERIDVAAHVAGPAATETSSQVCTVCGYVITPALGHTHKFDSAWKTDAASHWHECIAGDGAVTGKEAHTFGEWTVTKNATSSASGEKEHTCSVCGYVEKEEIKYVSYGEATATETSWTSDSTSGLTFRSTADFSKFVEVRVDNVKVDPANYEVKEGSTVVTFKASYLKTLSEGEHTVAIVSEDGESSAKFSVSEKTEPAAQKGCGSTIGIAGIATVVVASMAGAALIRKKKEN